MAKPVAKQALSLCSCYFPKLTLTVFTDSSKPAVKQVPGYESSCSAHLLIKNYSKSMNAIFFQLSQESFLD